MTDQRNETPTTPEQLGRSYAALLDEEGWPTEEPVPPPASPPASPPAPPSMPVMETPPPPQRIVEALLFVGGEPLTAKRARSIVRGLTEDQFEEAIARLNADYRRQARPYALQTQGQGWVLTLRPRYRHVVARLYGGVREARLSTAAIDVLALVAYRQPATKSEVDSLRGADSGALLRQLVRRSLVQVTQRGDAQQKEVAYGTTPRFLEMFGLHSLDDLPKTHDLQQL